MIRRFAGKVAIVTGSGSGLGEAVARQLAGEGALVAGFDLAGSDHDVDVSDPASVSEAVAAVASTLGRPEVLVNCAGVGGFHHSTEISADAWNRILAVNLTGTFLMCQAVLPHLLDGGGSIVNIASNSGIQGVPYAAAYCASKGGVVLLTKSLSLEFAGGGVRVNAVAPGGIDTPMLAGFRFPRDADASRLTSRSRLSHATPEEIAVLIAYVASEEARFMTGSIVSIDGGVTA